MHRTLKVLTLVSVTVPVLFFGGAWIGTLTGISGQTHRALDVLGAALGLLWLLGVPLLAGFVLLANRQARITWVRRTNWVILLGWLLSAIRLVLFA